MTKLDYARPCDSPEAMSAKEKRRSQDRCGFASLTCGCAGILMNLLFVNGLFASPTAGLPLLAGLFTLLIPVMGILLALIAGDGDSRPTFWGVMLSGLSIIISVGMVASYFSRMAI